MLLVGVVHEVAVEMAIKKLCFTTQPWEFQIDSQSQPWLLVIAPQRKRHAMLAQLSLHKRNNLEIKCVSAYL
jgi:hypothetical protein